MKINEPDYFHDHQKEKRKRRNTLFSALFVTLAIPFVFAAAFLSGSTALRSDAWHLFQDAIAIWATVYAHHVSSAKGLLPWWKRNVSSIVGFVGGVILVLTLLHTSLEAGIRFWNGAQVNSVVAMLGAVIALLANSVSAYLLYGYHHHDHGVGQAFTEAISDIAVSAAVLVGLFGVWATGRQGADSILSIVVSFYLIAFPVRRLVWNSLQKLRLSWIGETIVRIRGVQSVHCLHINERLKTVHVVIDVIVDHMREVVIRKQVEVYLSRFFGYVLVNVENQKNMCTKPCDLCHE